MAGSRTWLQTSLGLVVLLITACASDPPTPTPNLRITSVSSSDHHEEGSTTIHPAACCVFVTLQVEQDPNIPEEYDWLETVALDAKDRIYEGCFASVGRSESTSEDMFKIPHRTVHPTQVELVFEMPLNTPIERIRVAHYVPARVAVPRR